MPSDTAPNLAVFVVSQIDQARLLASPIKLRIIQELARHPLTTKQVADLLGEKPTRLYRHVEALHQAELISLVAEKPKRGTVEKYFLAVARRFEIHPNLFAPTKDAKESADDGGEAWWEELLNDSHAHIRQALRDMMTNPASDEELQPCFQKFSIRASEQQIKDLRQQLISWMEQCEQSDSAEAALEWSGFIAFYPGAQ